MTKGYSPAKDRNQQEISSMVPFLVLVVAVLVFRAAGAARATPLPLLSFLQVVFIAALIVRGYA